jgi:hypothetical protein
MLALMCVWGAGLSVVALFVENMLGWFLFFSPGWANGFPFGLSFQAVLSIGMTIYFLLLIVTAVAGVGAIVALILICFQVEDECASWLSRKWRWFAVVFLCISAWIFWRAYVLVWQSFPDGYTIS